MGKESIQMGNLNCRNEFGILKKLIICPPKYLKINQTNKRYRSETINVNIAMEQYQDFVRVLISHGVEVFELFAEEKLNDQVFTRDIGFCVGEQLFVSAMGSEKRKGEVGALMGKLKQENIPFKKLVQSPIEGGDIMIDNNKVWVGLSDRTSLSATQALQALIPSYTIIPLPIEKRILHLDCAFNIIDEKLALVYPAAFSTTDLNLIKEHFDIIEVTDDEQLTSGTNVLSIGNKKIISMPQNERVNLEMSNRGYEIIEVKYSEIIKSNGSFRCSSLPLLRI
ncbi:dimethylarginine dimethylaminohydrolase family protein [Paenisporosarcina sp. TG20]|uniref:dimethylarginine dimethylaminohydrolase family protein n=1 Tax=Paenisporosarcina sp. TG20 TaxID=1211706 RepID=UPI0002D84D9B|nr:arginine deiminase family protein [Paenisporosarcina sp. TG20]